MRGQVHGVLGGVYRVVSETGEEMEASLRGRLKRDAGVEGKVVVGDWVRVKKARGEEAGGTIEEVEPRNSQVVRQGPGGRHPKLVAANVDRLVVVVAVARPPPRMRLMDRLLVVGEVNELRTSLVMNKVDLGNGEAARIVALYRQIGYPVLETSAVTGEGLGRLEKLLCSGTSALVGPSGGGKSSLLNALEPGLNLRTGELSPKKGRGRHTTVSGRLIQLECGGLVVDTPGFSDVGIWGADPRELESCFPEFEKHREECHFRECSHLHEPNCGVHAALEEGLIHPERFQSYRALVEEAEETESW